MTEIQLILRIKDLSRVNRFRWKTVSHGWIEDEDIDKCARKLENTLIEFMEEMRESRNE
jgi:hypothetical protein